MFNFNAMAFFWQYSPSKAPLRTIAAFPYLKDAAG